MEKILVSTQELADHLDDPGWVVFDTRHDLAKHDEGRHAYAEGHVPGAYYLDLEDDLSGPKTGANGRHPLPDLAEFARRMNERGVKPASQVVVYDDSGASYAGRLWWMLRWLGHERTALLDGGFRNGNARAARCPPRRPRRAAATSSRARAWAPPWMRTSSGASRTTPRSHSWTRVPRIATRARRRRSIPWRATSPDRSTVLGEEPRARRPVQAAAGPARGAARPARRQASGNGRALVRLRRDGVPQHLRAGARRAFGRTPVPRIVERVVRGSGAPDRDRPRSLIPRAA